MTWQIGNYYKNNCVIFNTIQGVFALSSYLDGLRPVFIYRQTLKGTGIGFSRAIAQHLQTQKPSRYDRAFGGAILPQG